MTRQALLSALSLVMALGCSASSSGSGARTPTPTPTPITTEGNPLLGINTLWANSWYPVVPFANVLLSARKPCAPGAWGTPAAVDADGNPTADFSIVVYEGTAMAGFSGRYRLAFHGQATVTGFAAAVSGQTWDPATNTTTADVDVDASQNAGLHFTGTRREPGDIAATGLTALTLTYPGTSATQDVLTPHFLAAVAPFGILRPMQAQNPRNPIRTWSERTRPRGPGAVNDSPGMAFEHLVLLANAARRDVWINVPYYLDAEGQTRLAQLLEFGSDGDLPYTGAFGSRLDPATNPRPAPHDPSSWTPGTTAWYPPLNAGRHAYVELSNELWNYAGDYWGNELAADAVAEYRAGDAHHYGIFGDNPGYLRLARQGRLHVELAERFRAVVGDAELGDRYRMVLASQIDWDDVLRGPMTYIATVYGGHQNDGASLGALVTPEDGRANSFGNPAWPVSRYVHYLSGAPYVSGATAADQLARLPYVNGLIARLKQYADLYGVKVIAYEGGAEGGPGFSDPGSREVVVEELREWFRQDPEAPFVYFGLADNQGFGLSPTVFDLDRSLWPKWAAIDEIAADLAP